MTLRLRSPVSSSFQQRCFGAHHFAPIPSTSRPALQRSSLISTQSRTFAARTQHSKPRDIPEPPRHIKNRKIDKEADEHYGDESVRRDKQHKTAAETGDKQQCPVPPPKPLTAKIAESMVAPVQNYHVVAHARISGATKVASELKQQVGSIVKTGTCLCSKPEVG
jgi:hypothetical protein